MVGSLSIGLLVAGAIETPGAALRDGERLAYLVAMAIFVRLGLFMSIVSVHLPALLQRRGLSLAEAVSLGAMLAAANLTLAAVLWGPVRRIRRVEPR